MTLKLSSLSAQMLLDCADGKIRTKNQIIEDIKRGKAVTPIFTIDREIIRAMASDASYDHLKSINSPLLSTPGGQLVEVDL